MDQDQEEGGERDTEMSELWIIPQSIDARTSLSLLPSIQS